MSARPAVKAPASRKRTTSSSSSGRGKRRRRAATRARRRTGVLRTLMVSVAVAAVVLVAGTATAGALVVYGLTAPISPPDTESIPEQAPVLLAPRPPGVAGYGVEQLANACVIMQAGRDLGLDDRDQTIAVMAAMGESSLRNIDYGDWETSGVTNPDGSRTTSIGLFQQQDGWGSRDTRLDPYQAAGLFYRAMIVRVPDRANLEPTLVAHRTQINANPRHYERYWHRALRVVAALNATPLDGDDLDGIEPCPPA